MMSITQDLDHHGQPPTLTVDRSNQQAVAVTCLSKFVDQIQRPFPSPVSQPPPDYPLTGISGLSPPDRHSVPPASLPNPFSSPPHSPSQTSLRFSGLSSPVFPPT
ncbi:hypothetical protein F2P56_008237 [Juglans regia]|uniref:Uncharacterized protein n=1 Tax=Juglans regia TaxID=51240 RepID=A0A833XU92_JUGRE|nr:hypothetical protein F2P56_008237 [Juglans regia]